MWVTWVADELLLSRAVYMLSANIMYVSRVNAPCLATGNTITMPYADQALFNILRAADHTARALCIKLPS